MRYKILENARRKIEKVMSVFCMVLSLPYNEHLLLLKQLVKRLACLFSCCIRKTGYFGFCQYKVIAKISPCFFFYVLCHWLIA